MLKVKSKIKPRLNKVAIPFSLDRLKAFRNVRYYRPGTTSYSGFKEEPVFKKLKLVAQIEVQI